MDLGHRLSNQAYNNIVKHIYASVKKIYDYTCKKAVEEEKKLNEENGRLLLSVKVSGGESGKNTGFLPYSVLLRSLLIIPAK